MHAVEAALRKKQILLRRSDTRRVFLGKRLAELLKDAFSADSAFCYRQMRLSYLRGS